MIAEMILGILAGLTVYLLVAGMLYISFFEFSTEQIIGTLVFGTILNIFVGAVFLPRNVQASLFAFLGAIVVTILVMGFVGLVCYRVAFSPTAAILFPIIILVTAFIAFWNLFLCTVKQNTYSNNAVRIEESIVHATNHEVLLSSNDKRNSYFVYIDV